MQEGAKTSINESALCDGDAVIDRDPLELLPGLGVQPGCKVALAREVFSLASALRIRGCRVVTADVPVPSASLTILVAITKAEVPGLAAYAQSLAEVSSLWVAVPRKTAQREGLPRATERAELSDLQSVFVPLGLSDNKLVSFGSMLVAYRFVRKPSPPRAVGGPEDDLDLLEEKLRRIREKERRHSFDSAPAQSGSAPSRIHFLTRAILAKGRGGRPWGMRAPQMPWRPSIFWTR